MRKQTYGSPGASKEKITGGKKATMKPGKGASATNASGKVCK